MHDRRHYRRHMTLISVEELTVRISRRDDDLVVCDVRFDLADHDRGQRDYNASHIPGARFVDLHHELALHDGTSPTGGGRHPLPTTSQFAQVLERHGITPSSFVVAYDDAGGAVAARLWWMLRSVGHQHVAVLDGGYPAWVAAGAPTQVDAPVVEPSTYVVPSEWSGVVTADEVVAAIENGRTVIDSRAEIRYRGDTEPLDPRAGHVPGAVNLFHGGHLGEGGLHRPVSELRDRFNALDLGEQPIAYCGSGVTACHNLLVMCTLGIADPGDALLYPGSWSEWSRDENRPVATGDEP